MPHDDASDAHWKSINIDLQRIAERLDRQAHDLHDAAGEIVEEYCSRVDGGEESAPLAVELYDWADRCGRRLIGPVRLGHDPRDHCDRLALLCRVVNNLQHRIGRHGADAFSLDTTKRNARTRFVAMHDGYEAADPAAHGIHAAMGREELELLAEFIRQLPEQDARLALDLAKGKTIVEVSHDLGISKSAARARRSRLCRELIAFRASRHRKPSLGDAAPRPGEAGQGGFVGHDEGDQNGEENQAEHHERPGRLVQRPGRTLRTPARRRVHRRDRQRHEQHERPAPRPHRPEHGIHGCASCTRAADDRPHVDKGTLRVRVGAPIARHRCAA
ncbi:MAG: hypothetical protein DYG93_06295 [Leptolyngbya sp. PLA2]|nr:hypothetical protein [Leptolyngbya sp. PL-A2]